MAGRALATLATAAGTCLLAAGCGGGSGSGDAPSPALSRVAFVRQANEICNRTVKRVGTEGFVVLQRYVRKSGRSVEQVEPEVVRKWLGPRIQGEIDELRALGAPQGDEERVETILDALQSVIDKAAENPRRYLYEQRNFKRPYREVQKLSAAYGIAPCGQP